MILTLYRSGRSLSLTDYDWAKDTWKGTKVEYGCYAFRVRESVAEIERLYQLDEDQKSE